jgi:hypothetical protein
MHVSFLTSFPVSITLYIGKIYYGIYFSIVEEFTLSEVEGPAHPALREGLGCGKIG